MTDRTRTRHPEATPGPDDWQGRIPLPPVTYLTPSWPQAARMGAVRGGETTILLLAVLAIPATMLPSLAAWTTVARIMPLALCLWAVAAAIAAARYRRHGHVPDPASLQARRHAVIDRYRLDDITWDGGENGGPARTTADGITTDVWLRAGHDSATIWTMHDTDGKDLT